MKVWQLKKINEVANEKYYSLDYNLLLAMDQKDIDLLINEIESENIEYLIDFLKWIYENPNWEENYSHMKGIENINLKEYLFNEIANASCKEDASAILSYFDFDQEADRLFIFKSIEEWKNYIENINSSLGDESVIKLDNIEVVLKNSKEEENRVNLIEKVMKYLQSDELELISLSDYPIINFGKLPITYDELLDLFLMGYYPIYILDLLNHWRNKKSIPLLTDIENKKIDDGFQEIINYLKESSMMIECDIDSFNNMVKDLCSNEYKGLVNILREIEKEEDFELLETCIGKEAPFSNQNMRIYIDRIFHSNDKCNYRTAQLRLWENDTIEKYLEDSENMNRIMNQLMLAKDNQLDCLYLASLIEELPTVEIIKNLDIGKVQKDTFEMVCTRFSHILKKEELLEEDVENYAKLLGDIGNLPKDICSKVIGILGIRTVKNMELEDRKKLQKILLNPENYGSLDYIYAEYQNRENSLYSQPIRNPEPIKQDSDSSNHEVKLVTVLELLENGMEMSAVLDGFTDDDEITPKTLIRSLAYKNNQN